MQLREEYPANGTQAVLCAMPKDHLFSAKAVISDPPSPAKSDSSPDRKLKKIKPSAIAKIRSALIKKTASDQRPRSRRNNGHTGLGLGFQFFRVNQPEQVQPYPDQDFITTPNGMLHTSDSNGALSILCQDFASSSHIDEESDSLIRKQDARYGDSLVSSKWSFKVVASLQGKPSSLASDVIAAIDFDESGSFFATGGIARKIRVCSYNSLVNAGYSQASSHGDNEDSDDEADDDFLEERLQASHEVPLHRLKSSRGKPEFSGSFQQNHDEAAVKMICTPAKLSSLKWRPLGCNVIGCGDYDGVVTEWDVEQGLCVNERYDHSGQRIWSIDYSRWFPTLCASASSDGTVRLWSHNCDRSVGVIRSPGKNSFCSAEFNLGGPHKIAIACADSNIYLYDLRRLDCSYLCLQGHERAASYVRFMGDDELVSASIDSTVRVWDIRNVSSLYRTWNDFSSLHNGSGYSKRTGADRLRTIFRSHRNMKNFVGLSVLSDGLIACGSETNEVFVYERSGGLPLWRMEFPELGGTSKRQHCDDHVVDGHFPNDISGRHPEGGVSSSGAFVGAICWRQKQLEAENHSLITANSEGTVQLVTVNRK